MPLLVLFLLLGVSCVDARSQVTFAREGGPQPAIEVKAVEQLAPLCSDSQSEPCFTNALAITYPFADYTDAARKAHLEGTVRLLITVGADGRVHDPQVQKSLDPGLDKQALKTIKQWKFQPATYDGKPTAIHTKVNMDFHLR